MDGSTNDEDRVQLEHLVAQALEDLRERMSGGGGDLGVALVDLLAWASDLLSCYADRVADEAYLDSDRGISVRIDGLPWRQVRDLGASSEDDSHYVVRPGDGGTRVVEFGDGVHGRRPPGDASIEARYRTPGQGATVRVEPGRVVVGPPRVAEPDRFFGVYRGLVLDRVDPLLMSRLLVRVPAVTGDAALWAAASLPAGGAGELPEVGDQVWVAFEAGDPSFPVWLGVGVTD